MDAEGVKKKEEEQTAVVPSHTVVETPQELTARLAEEEKDIQVLALTWDTEGVTRYYTAGVIRITEEKGLNDRQVFVNLKKKQKTKPHQEKKKILIANFIGILEFRAVLREKFFDFFLLIFGGFSTSDGDELVILRRKTRTKRHQGPVSPQDYKYYECRILGPIFVIIYKLEKVDQQYLGDDNRFGFLMLSTKLRTYQSTQSRPVVVDIKCSDNCVGVMEMFKESNPTTFSGQKSFEDESSAIWISKLDKMLPNNESGKSHYLHVRDCNLAKSTEKWVQISMNNIAMIDRLEQNSSQRVKNGKCYLQGMQPCHKAHDENIYCKL
uniref:Uncharacterized protein n=1 Tax=Romanomermis culicivorax TaxID=13658 RepID=A0A915HXW1_ROMCU